MNNISSSNYYNVSTSSSTNISMAGLISGMDTEKMVTQMLSGTQSKIDKLNQQKQQINWKTDIYHDIVSTINNFRNTYLDSSYGASAVNNLANKNFFNSMTSAITGGDSVRIASTSTDAQPRDMSIKVNQLATKAQFKSVEKMSGDQSITGGSINADKIEKLLSAEGGQYSFELSLDGVTKAITLTAADFKDGITEETIASAVKGKVSQAFGSYVQVDTTDNKLKFSINIFDDDGNLEAGHEMRITGTETDLVGIKAGASSHVSMMDTLGSLSGVTGEKFEFSINGENFSFDKDTSISKMMSTINSSKAGVKLTYSSMTDTFSIEASSTGKQYGIDITQTQGNVLSRIFGESSFSEPDENGATKMSVNNGKDALLEIDGVSTSRSSNTFTIDGITMTAVKVSDEATTIGTKRDVDSIVDGIKAFVNDYNAMMTKFTELTSEKSEYKNYPPLTEAQKAEMTSTQIELWEKNAKMGLVRNDPDITNFMEAMKAIPYSIASKSGLALFSIGIDTKPWDKTGALEIDEAALRSAIESNPDAVIDLFTDKSTDSAVKGIAAQMAQASDNAAKTSAGSPGTLVRLAGAKNYITFEKNNDLYYDLMNINDRLSQLQSRYNQERARYMNQFTQMEKIMANFSTQSGMLLQQFGGY